MEQAAFGGGGGKQSDGGGGSHPWQVFLQFIFPVSEHAMALLENQNRVFMRRADLTQMMAVFGVVTSNHGPSPWMDSLDAPTDTGRANRARMWFGVSDTLGVPRLAGPPLPEKNTRRDPAVHLRRPRQNRESASDHCRGHVPSRA